MKPAVIFMLALVCISIQPAAHAQFAVIDKANLAQALQQVEAWKKQYQQMLDQRNQLQQQYAAQTGSRGLGSFASNPALQATVPADLQQTYTNLQNSGTPGMTAPARAIRQQTAIYNCDNLAGNDLVTCQRLLGNNAQHQALMQQALALTGARTAQIQALQDKINNTADPKSIAELQARLQAEQTQVGNDANRLLLMRGLGDAADRAAEQALREKTLRSLSLHNDGSDSFHFVPPKQP